MKINASVRYEVVVLAIPRCLSRIVRRTLGAVPSLTAVLRELRGALSYLERLATFAAAELPEITYQLEKIREQLASIERRLAGENRRPVSPDERQSGSRRPS